MSPEILKQVCPSQFAELYPIQVTALDAIADARDSGLDAGYLNMATGTGKTLVAAHDVAEFMRGNQGARLLYLCHTTDILDQARGVFEGVLPSEVAHGNLHSGDSEVNANVVYATFQAMTSRLEDGCKYQTFGPEEFDYIVVDEAHHGAAPTYKNVIDHFRPKFLLGLTATPDRRDQADITQIFKNELYKISLEDAIAEGHLVEPDYRVIVGDLSPGSLIDQPAEPGILNEIPVNEIAARIKENLSDIEDPRTVIFCPDVNSTEALSEVLDSGSATYHSGLSKAEQNKRLAAFRLGEIKTLVVVDMLNEGVDVPEINTVVFLRSTQSRTVFLQQLGRGLRKIPGKDNVRILDFVANWSRLKDVIALEKAVNQRPESRSLADGKPRRSKFKINFSQEAITAIEAMKAAEKTAILNTENPLKKRLQDPGARKEKQARHLGELKKMLGVAELPDQTLGYKDWEEFDRRLLGDKESVLDEIMSRQLSRIYSSAKYLINKINDSEVNVEDTFQELYVSMKEKLQSFDSTKHGSLRDFFGNNLYNSVTRVAMYRGLVLNGNVQSIVDTINGKNFSSPGCLSEEESDFAQQARFASRDNILDFDKLDGNGFVEHEQIETMVAAELERAVLYRVIGRTLDLRERYTLVRRYGLAGKPESTLDAIGITLDISKERVRQIQRVALQKLASDRSFADTTGRGVVDGSEANTRLVAKEEAKLRGLRRVLRAQLKELEDCGGVDAPDRLKDDIHSNTAILYNTVDKLAEAKATSARQVAIWRAEFVAKGTVADKVLRERIAAARPVWDAK